MPTIRPSQRQSALPIWRQLMTSTDTLYEVGGHPGNAAATISWPAAGSGNALMSGGLDNNAAYMHRGYGSAVYASDVGRYGKLIFGTTGETCITNQLTEFALSDDVPAWAWFQQPDYPISEAAAITADADAYYSEADYAALASDKKIIFGDEPAFSAAWDETFPVGYQNWVIRRKFQKSFTGNERPHYFRYDMPMYIPPSMTGTGAGAIIVTNFGTIHGPFGGQGDGDGGHPQDTTHADWFADVNGGSGRRKKYLWAMNVNTKVWTRLATELPDIGTQSPDVDLPRACKDVAAKKVYWLCIDSSARSILELDFSAGLAGFTVDGPTALTVVNDASMSQIANTILCLPTGALAGNRLLFGKTGSSLVLVDINNLTLRTLAVSGLPSNSLFWSFSFLPATNTLYITMKNAGTSVTYYSIPIPTGYTDAANYTATSHSLALAPGVTLEDHSSSIHAYGSDRNTAVLESLGVILLNQYTSRMLAFRPSV
jgi:hypothetical protein